VQIRVVDPHATLVAELRPELAEHLGGRAHAAPLHQLVKPVCRRCDAEAEEQQCADLAVQLARLRESGLQAVDFGGEADFIRQDVGHGNGLRRI
jgi:hypothetical protein